jgi:serine/threonine-protein kinase
VTLDGTSTPTPNPSSTPVPVEHSVSERSAAFRAPTPPKQPPSKLREPQVQPASRSTPSWKSNSGLLFSLSQGADFGPRYRIERMLGEGGMGAVYKAYDRDLDRTIAIKLLQPGLMANPDALQRFKQELLLASKISHRNILRIHDLGDVDGVKFISMAFVDGEDLHALLKKRGRLPMERAIHIARQLADALHAAHSEGVAHRDLKPHNILIDSTDQIYVSDFGLAKSLDSAVSGMTHAGQVLGTPRYMAPEQVEGKGADHRSDLYAYGLILYEMLTGDTPFGAQSTIQMMYQRVKEKPKNPKTLNPEIPDYLARIVMRCLEREPFRRYQSAHEILADLDAQKATSASHTVQISLAVPTTKRGWLLGSAALLVVLALLALAIPPVRYWIFGRPPEVSGPVAGIPPLAQGKYIAVLPFRVLGDEKSLAYIGEGMSEALSAKLFQLKGIHVTSASPSDVEGRRDSITKIARSLGANLIVDGVVQGAGDRIRVIVNLNDAAAGRRLWSREFSGVPQDVLSLEDQIHGEMLSALELKPGADELARSTARPTDNIAAYDFYLKGRNALRGQQDVKNVEAAVKFFESALEKDPQFAIAYTGLADASLRMYNDKKDPIWSQRAIAAAERAQQLNDKLPEVLYSLGSVYNATGKSSEAIAVLKRAIELAPSSDEGHRRLGDVYRAAGQKAEAVRAYQKAIEANPYFWVNHNALGSALLRAGNSEEAIKSFQKVTQLEPENRVGYDNIGAVYLRQGKWEEGIPYLQKALALQPYFKTYSNLGVAYFALKRFPEAVQMFEKAVEMNPNDELTVGNLADSYRASGDSQQANETYDKAIALAFKELQVNPRSTSSLEGLALYYAKKGDANQALQFIRRARGIDRSSVGLIYSEVVVNSLAGKTKEALVALREGLQKGLAADTAKNDPELKSLQDKPEFQKLIKEFESKK